MPENHTDVIPKFTSYSALDTWLSCGRSFELSRVRRVKRRPGPWFPRGTAIHATIERYLRSTLEVSE